MVVKLKWMAVRAAEPFTPKMWCLRYFGHAVAPLCVVAESIWNGAVPKRKGEGRHSLLRRFESVRRLWYLRKAFSEVAIPRHLRAR